MCSLNSLVQGQIQARSPLETRKNGTTQPHIRTGVVPQNDQGESPRTQGSKDIQPPTSGKGKESEQYINVDPPKETSQEDEQIPTGETPAFLEMLPDSYLHR